MKHAIAIALLFVFAATAADAQMHGPPPMTRAQFENAATGSAVDLAVRVASIKRDDVRADLLERLNETTYKVTGTSVDLFDPADTPIVMGSRSDVKPGAVLFVSATATGRDSADVKKIVVITSYVSVK